MADLVAWLGAVQAQEYQAAKWGLAQRMREGVCDADIDRAFDEGQILRTHVMRPTWHFVTSTDIAWMLQLTGARVQRTVASYNRRQGLDPATLVRAAGIFERALAGGRFLTRPELGAQLSRRGLEVSALQLGLLTLYAELESVVCSGPRRGKQFTYALLSERAPGARRLPRDEALTELTRRYFRSHGPATIRDFVWWSGLTTADARRGLDAIDARSEVVQGLTYWSLGEARIGGPASAVLFLPIYDEYMISYRDRVAVPHGPGTLKLATGAVTFQHALVSGGQVAGTWRTARRENRAVVHVLPLRRFTRGERQGIAGTAARYGRFLGTPVSVSIADHTSADQ